MCPRPRRARAGYEVFSAPTMALRHLAGNAVSALFRFVPRPLRFGTALAVATAAAPLLRRHPIVRGRLDMRVETACEIVAYHLLDVLTRRGVTFDPRLHIAGREHYETAVARGKGVLFIGPHTMLSTLALRELWDLGLTAAVIAPDDVAIPGTTERFRAIPPSFTYLLEVRRTLMTGGIVVAMVDRAELARKAHLEVMTTQGPLVIADALIHLAARAQATVVFSAARIAGRQAMLTHVPAPQGTSADEVTQAFIAFLQAHVTEVAKAG
jgi:lauroyl/myristoyl acyltransferase